MVAAALLLLVQMKRADAVLAFIIVGREIAISHFPGGWQRSGGRKLWP